MCLDCYQEFYRLRELATEDLTGGIGILWGNLAPYGAVVKKSSVKREMYFHFGPARVFDSEGDALQLLNDGKIKPKEVIVIRYIGKKGGPGMPEILCTTSAMSRYENVALVTDGRFSGGSTGAVIGHVDPEAMDGGPIAIVKDGDIICYDISNSRLSVALPYDEIIDRLGKWTPPKRERLTGILKHYVDSLPPSPPLDKLKRDILKFCPENNK